LSLARIRFEQDVVERLCENVRSRKQGGSLSVILGSPKPLVFRELSSREQEVLVWSSKGKSNGTIATLMGMSNKTVEFHFSSIFKKLRVNNRVIAVLQAIKERLISP
jgi:DNA-binding NarL/FixJ family response regulator